MYSKLRDFKRQILSLEAGGEPLIRLRRQYNTQLRAWRRSARVIRGGGKSSRFLRGGSPGPRRRLQQKHQSPTPLLDEGFKYVGSSSDSDSESESGAGAQAEEKARREAEPQAEEKARREAEPTLFFGSTLMTVFGNIKSFKVQMINKLRKFRVEISGNMEGGDSHTAFVKRYLMYLISPKYREMSDVDKSNEYDFAIHEQSKIKYDSDTKLVNFDIMFMPEDTITDVSIHEHEPASRELLSFKMNTQLYDKLKRDSHDQIKINVEMDKDALSNQVTECPLITKHVLDDFKYTWEFDIVFDKDISTTYQQIQVHMKKISYSAELLQPNEREAGKK